MHLIGIVTTFVSVQQQKEDCWNSGYDRISLYMVFPPPFLHQQNSQLTFFIFFQINNEKLFHFHVIFFKFPEKKNMMQK